MKSRLVTGACGLLLTVGLAGDRPRDVPVETVEVVPVEMMSPADKFAAHVEFERVKRFWLEQGVGGLAATKLVVLNGAESFECGRFSVGGGSSVVTAHGSSQFCPDSNAVVITAVSVNAQNALGLGMLGNRHIIDHEIGHGVTLATGELGEDNFTEPGASVANEIRATYYAGMYAGACLSDEEIRRLDDHARETATIDIIHGTPDQQADAFLAGVSATPPGVACPS